EVEDEHQLLWRVLATLMKYQRFPDDAAPESLKLLDPAVVTRVESSQDSRNLLEIWNALGLEPHPALCYVVTAPLDLDITLEAPLVLTKTVRYKRIGVEAVDRNNIQIGGVVRDASGAPLQHVTVRRDSGQENAVTNAAGQYVLRAIPAGSVVLRVVRE